MTSTIFGKNAYDDGIRDAIGKVIDEWGFRFPGRLIIPRLHVTPAVAAPRRTACHERQDRRRPASAPDAAGLGAHPS